MGMELNEYVRERSYMGWGKKGGTTTWGKWKNLHTDRKIGSDEIQRKMAD